MKTVAILCVCFIFYGTAQCNSPSLEVTSVEDVYDYLWDNNEDIAYETLKLDFLRQMENGSLQAELYVNFTMQDLNYALKVGDMLKEISSNQTLPDDLKDLLNGRYKSYRKLSDSMLKAYWFETVPAIKSTPAMTKYLSTYENLLHKEPIYFVVGLVPCSRLWVWLANNLNILQTNAYYTWKKGNSDGHPEKHYRAVLDKYLDTHDKVLKANYIFREQMMNEYEFFRTSYI